MGITSALIGGFTGAAVHSLSNSVKKVPISRRAKYTSWEKRLVEDINEIRADKGMPPIVGTKNWIRYSAEEK